MSEMALITAVFALLFSVGASLWIRSLAFRSERTADLTAELQAQLALSVEAMAKLTSELPDSRVIEVEGTVRTLKLQFDHLVLEVEKHRAAVHKSIQRFDQIMRRNERAAAVIEAAQSEEEGLELDPDAEETVDTQEGDRSFLEKPDRSQEEVAAILRARNPNGGQNWDERRRAMQRQWYENHGGMQRVPHLNKK